MHPGPSLVGVRRDQVHELVERTVAIRVVDASVVGDTIGAHEERHGVCAPLRDDGTAVEKQRDLTECAVLGNLCSTLDHECVLSRVVVD